MLTGKEMAKNIQKKCQKKAGDIANNTEKLCLSESSVITSFCLNSGDSGIVLPFIDKATLITALGNTLGCTKESNKYCPSIITAAPCLDIGSQFDATIAGTSGIKGVPPIINWLGISRFSVVLTMPKGTSISPVLDEQ